MNFIGTRKPSQKIHNGKTQWKTVASALGWDRRVWLAKARAAFQLKVVPSLIETEDVDPFDTYSESFVLERDLWKGKPGATARPGAVVSVNTV